MTDCPSKFDSINMVNYFEKMLASRVDGNPAEVLAFVGANNYREP